MLPLPRLIIDFDNNHNDLYLRGGQGYYNYRGPDCVVIFKLINTPQAHAHTD